MNSNVLRVGIMPFEEFKKRTLLIAQGKLKPDPKDPKIWFSSIRTAAEVLSEDNRVLLRILATKKPATVTALAVETGRAVSNVSRTLKTLAKYGIVELKKSGKTMRPRALATHFEIVAR
jgi:predicted transcriptional regulator